MASKVAHKRLIKEYKAIQLNPPDYIVARPLETNILEWHYVIRGPEDSPYEGGEYYGKVIFPGSYPFAPPSIKMLTPNGRFETDFRLCLSMSDYHPGSWNPSWSVATILTGLLSFMLEDSPTTGSIVTTLKEKQVYAKASRRWNLENAKFREVYPDLLEAPVTVTNAIRSPIAAMKAEAAKKVKVEQQATEDLAQTDANSTKSVESLSGTPVVGTPTEVLDRKPSLDSSGVTTTGANRKNVGSAGSAVSTASGVSTTGKKTRKRLASPTRRGADDRNRDSTTSSLPSRLFKSTFTLGITVGMAAVLWLICKKVMERV